MTTGWIHNNNNCDDDNDDDEDDDGGGVVVMINTLPVSCDQWRNIFESNYIAAKDAFTRSYESEIT
jgi:formaldehyde-activating enzyme involved in methanogenesis